MERFIAEELSDSELEIKKHIEERIETGNPADAILSVVVESGVDLIIMGVRHPGALKQLLVGSVAHQIMENNQVPVMVVPI